jgi:hypothetical protein
MEMPERIMTIFCRAESAGSWRGSWTADAAFAPSVGHQSGLIENPAGGEPLPAPVKGLFESRFGHDFGRVRIHADTGADDSAQALDAQAYTKGNHIVFGRDRYAPDSVAGRRLLAHELAHVVQQHHAAGEGVQRKPAEGKRFYSLEEMYGEEENRYLQYLYPENFTSLRRDSALVMRAIWHAKSQEASVTFEYLLGGGPHGSAIPNLVREFFYRLVFRNVGLMNKGSATLKLRFVRTGLGLGGKSGERKIAEAARYLDMFLNNEQSLKRNKRVAIERADTTQVIGTSGEDKEIRVPVTELTISMGAVGPAKSRALLPSCIR